MPPDTTDAFIPFIKAILLGPGEWSEVRAGSFRMLPAKEPPDVDTLLWQTADGTWVLCPMHNALAFALKKTYRPS